MTQPLSVSEAPLAGSMLVEASAGTGKTWTIAALHLRLLLEKRIPVERILVVTFGKAATAELKRRIRERIAEVSAALDAGDIDALAGSDDPLLAHVAHMMNDPKRATGPKRDALRLALALESFDLAPVLTIHGFCQRALAEHAFESGMPFETEVVPDESALIEEIVQDFWRREMAEATPVWARWLAERGRTPAKLVREIEVIQQRPYAGVVGPEACDDGAIDAFVEACHRAQSVWQAERDRIRQVIEASSVWQKNWFAPRFRDADAWFAGPVHVSRDPGLLTRFSAEEIASAAGKKKKPAPSHEFFGMVDQMLTARDAALASLEARYAMLLVRLAAFCREELARRKDERGLMGYNDLLVRLRDALAGPGGDELARALAERYPAALIDEFQDTDPIQYDIFRRIYGATDLPVVFVGDPKQAIYGFRGGDVNTYLAARAETDARHTLVRNFRSIAPLVAAVNEVFAGAAPFFDAGIEFPAAVAADRAQPSLASPDRAAPLTFWFMSRNGDGKPISKERANALAALATAAEIASLLGAARRGEAKLGKRALEGGDIAVLVASHHQGALVREKLAALGIPSVSYGQDSVFESPEAREVERVLAAVAEPARETRVRVALATDMFGVNGDALAALDTDADAWEDVLARFARYHALAVEHGFAAMWRALIDGEGVPKRLLGHVDGERRLTNVRHLADLLQSAEASDGLDLEGLLRFLAHARSVGDGDRSDADARQLRLESDEHLVRILTVHASKGLEFPIVFCPFLWEGRLQSARTNIVACHGDDGRALFDVGSPDAAAHRSAAARESFAERLRLAYVALTRARSRCVVAWGAVNEAETSAPAWLLHRSRDRAVGDLEAWVEEFKARNDSALRSDLEGLAAAGGGAIAVLDLPQSRGALASVPAGEEAPLAARPFTGRIARPWRVSSFSGIVARGESARREAERPDHDALWMAPAAAAGEPRGRGGDEIEGRTLFDFPRGVRAGTLIHALFERIDFTAPESDASRRLVREKLAEFDFDPGWAPVLERMLVDVVSTPLDPEAALRLSAVGSRQRIAELEFLFPVRHAPDALRAAFAPLRDLGSRLPEAIGRFVAAPERGFLRGFIDLVFEHRGRYYIADWKSNWLGAQFEDYAPDRLAVAIAESYYDLQYLVYTVALHRHLAARLTGYDYDTHFGGVYYLFVRGVGVKSDAGSGVHFARPARTLVERLDAALGADERMLP